MKKSGFVLVIGETNAGKSTLINRIIGSKISIVSHKVQTTRFKVLGIHTVGDNQIVFIDTPGIFTPKKDTDKQMVNISYSQIAEADIIMLLVDGQKGITEHTFDIISKLSTNSKNIFVLNKIDLITKEDIMKIISAVKDYQLFDRFFMISALKNNGVDDLLQYINANLVHDNWFYEEDQISDINLNILATEITREKVYKHLNQELPYNITINHLSWEETDNKITIHQDIVVNKESYKPMVIGKKGEKIKQIRVDAAASMKKNFQKNISLYLYVKVSS